MARASSEDSDQPGHPPSVIRVFAVRLMGGYGAWLSSSGQADLSLRWAHMPLCWFCREMAQMTVLADIRDIFRGGQKLKANETINLWTTQWTSLN